jgi:hypothetical protein
MNRIVLALPVFLLTACGTPDPYSHSDSWSPSGANAQNLAATIVNPRDLILGRGGSHAVGRQATGAVDRIWQDRPKPLLDATASPGGGASAAGAN